MIHSTYLFKNTDLFSDRAPLLCVAQRHAKVAVALFRTICNGGAKIDEVTEILHLNYKLLEINISTILTFLLTELLLIKHNITLAIMMLVMLIKNTKKTIKESIFILIFNVK